MELGAARRTRRLIKRVDDLSAQPTGSILLACGGWSETKAAYRLLDNPAVEWREILDVHATRTVERMVGQAVVLCIQDTTELDLAQSGFWTVEDGSPRRRAGATLYGFRTTVT